MPTLLIADDEPAYREVLSTIFAEEGYDIRTAPHGRAALAALRDVPADIIISDVRMPDMDGIQLLEAARHLHPDVGVILMTAFATIETARHAFKLGADDFIQKPFNNEELKLIVRRTLERQALVNENRAFRTAQRKSGSASNIIGSSPAMEDLHRMIRAVASEESTVMITGESGTGKELVARAIHDLSPRAEKPFVPVNCGALPDTLLESELFGYMKGAFTGAAQNRPGLFESAARGSIFLDEIGDTPVSMQVKLLRVLQERRIRRVGSPSETSIDVRVITATNRDLRPMVEDGHFRRDLWYRISVIPIRVPSLRERREDIAELARYFINKFSARSGKKVGISDKAVHILEQRSWPGNIRELEHTVERAVALTPDGDEIRPEYCSAEVVPEHNGYHQHLPEAGLHLPSYLNSIEKEIVEDALRRTANNQTRAAELLQIPVYALRHLITKHNLERKNNKVGATSL